MTGRQINCDQALRQLFAYLDHELDESELGAMQAHLHTCKSCFSRFEFERLLKDRVRSLRDEQATPGISERIKALLKAF
jgi:anti-sigma factor (TIGR02949 family)